MSPHATKTATPNAAPAQELTTSDLMSQPGTRPRVVSDTRGVLIVGGLPVATLGTDPSRISPLCARSAAGIPVIEMLAAIASQDPTGVLAIESANRESGFAFNVARGRVVSAKGPGPLGQLEPWCAAVHQRFPERFDCAPDDADRGVDPSWIRVAKTFVGERALEHLELALQPGVQLTFIRGDVEWVGTSLIQERAPSLSHLLLEHARRCDERPRLLQQLGSLSQIVVPLSEPAVEPTSPANKETSSDGDDDWDFFDDPDPAALAEWGDARALWPICDGQHSIEEAIEFSMLGRFRALTAMATLASRQHVAIAAAGTGGGADEELAAALVLDDDFDTLGEVVKLHAPPPPVPPKSRPTEANLSDSKPLKTGYAVTRPSTGIARLPTGKPTRARRISSHATVVDAPPPAAVDESAVVDESAIFDEPASPLAVRREDTEPRPSSSLSMVAIGKVRSAQGNPNVRLIGMALLAAALFIAGAAAALGIARVAAPTGIQTIATP